MAKPKTIVLTGVSRGLGRAMALEFAHLGHKVVGCARSREGVESLKSQLGAPHEFDVVDVTDDAAVGRWARHVLHRYKAPDLLVNNAAVINQRAPLWKVPLEEFSAVVEVNIKGVFHVLRHFVPAMVARGEGVIINISSGWGRTTDAEVAPYCASKFAIEGLTQALAQELPPGVTAVPLNPGIIDTDMLRACFGDTAALYPSPEKWARRAVPYMLELNGRDNGKPLTVPGA
jgi:NAD(P)-dependent dehydrogenase (short-subunit alcohol dehydrogenase family)